MNQSPLFDLTGRTALVTGGASGLGEAIAHGLARQGASLVLADLNAERLEKVSAELQTAEGGTGAGADTAGADTAVVDTVVLDVTDRAAVTSAVDDIVARHGQLDIVVNSAGITALDPVGDVPDEHWDRIVGINLTGTFAVCRAAANHMAEQGYGRMINIASQAAHVALENHAAYSASKSGLFGLTRSLARELGPHGVTANTISPTVVLTELGRSAWDGPHGDEHKAQIPAGRFAEPEEIAAAAVFLASTEAAMVNGTDLLVDGGFTII